MEQITILDYKTTSCILIQLSLIGRKSFCFIGDILLKNIQVSNKKTNSKGLIEILLKVPDYVMLFVQNL
jgi:hypothetical protein